MTLNIKQLKILSFQIYLVDLQCSLPVFLKPLNKCTGNLSLALAFLQNVYPSMIISIKKYLAVGYFLQSRKLTYEDNKMQLVFIVKFC